MRLEPRTGPEPIRSHARIEVKFSSNPKHSMLVVGRIPGSLNPCRCVETRDLHPCWTVPVS
jgi:hypothetical protein